MTIARALRLAAPAAVGALLVAGCSNTTAGSGSMSTSTASATATSTASGGSLESLSADEIVDKAKQALLDAKSVRVRGTVVEQNEPLTLDIRISEGDGEGNIRTRQGNLKVVVVNKAAYIQPDDAFWKAFGGSDPAILRMLSGKWIKPKAGDADWKDFLALFNFSSFAKELLTPAGAVTKDGTRSINGMQAIGISDTGPEAGTLWVATSGPPYPLLIQPKNPKEGSMAFSEFGVPVTATAPPASQIVDLGKVGG